MRGIKIPQQDFALKMWGRGGGGGVKREGGLFAGHYGMSSTRTCAFCHSKWRP